jgi:23S rRNA pseudouridine1911/1915/1917 synthase
VSTLYHEGAQATLTVAPEEAEDRLDTYLEARLPLSRSQIKAALGRGELLLNGAPPSKAGVRLRPHDQITVQIPPPPPLSLAPTEIPLDILYEDDDLVVLNKPPGLVVHPGPGHPGGTLVNALLHRYPRLPGSLGGDADEIRPGIVHRLDQDTSGVMVVARSDAAMKALAPQFAAHTIERRYLALVIGARLGERRLETGHGRHPTDRKRFTGRADSERRAITRIQTLEQHPHGTSLVACTLETGRTHQIRMHLSEASAPVLGDALYGGARAQTRLIARQALHAEILGFLHPDGRPLRFEAPPAPDFQAALEALRAGRRP